MIDRWGAQAGWKGLEAAAGHGLNKSCRLRTLISPSVGWDHPCPLAGGARQDPQGSGSQEKQVQQNQESSGMETCLFGVGGSMLRWGGSSPIPPAPQCMPSPNKLPSDPAARPESVHPSFLSAHPKWADSTQYSMGPLVPGLWQRPHGPGGHRGRGERGGGAPWH